ncbi:MAG: TetR/AcrR family transcriptional regulator [Chloroflexaceae bacterium]|nr:TetR/AcrR family transcriptional regulator [Chloroflexaceae bacterium]
MSKTEAIAKLVPVFRHYGYEGATVSRLSQATGLGKASLYHYFPKGKSEMAAAVLEYVERRFAQTVIAPLHSPGDPQHRLQSMCQSLSEFYNSGREACLLSILSHGEANTLFHQAIQTALTTWIEAIAQVLQEANCDRELAWERAEDAAIQIQGALILARVLDRTEPFQRIIAYLPRKLLASASSSV